MIVMKLGNDMKSVLLSGSGPLFFVFGNDFVRVFMYGLYFAEFSDVRRKYAI